MRRGLIMLKIDDQMNIKLKAKVNELLTDYDGRGVDIWDAVMLDKNNGYDLNIYQETENDPLKAFAYEVKNLTAIYDNWHEIDLTQ